MRDDELFIRETIDAIQDYRRVKGVEHMPHDRAYAAADFILKRLKSRGWQFSPPLMPMAGGLTGGRRKD